MSGFIISQNISVAEVDFFLNRLQGNWKMEDAEVYEVWKIGNDSTFYADVYKLNKADTLRTELVSIIKEKDEVFYQAQVFDQNNSQPVRFLLVHQSDSILSFENKDHDFPQLIEYKFIDDTSLRATISGMVDDNLKRIEFHYHKIQ